MLEPANQTLIDGEQSVDAFNDIGPDGVQLAGHMTHAQQAPSHGM
jgi:hypothetical protein